MCEFFENYQWKDNILCININESNEECIDINEIIGVKDCTSESKGSAHVYTIKRLVGNKLTQRVLKYDGQKDICQKFLTELKSKLKTITNRPRRLLVLISPKAGSQGSEQVYKDLVAPLFELADIATDVIVSESKNHMFDLLSTYAIETVDGIVSAGGDGSFSQSLNGIFVNTQKAANVDYHNPDVKLKTTTVPIGHIPLGTYNVVSRFCNGCVDIETAVLGIIRGSTKRLGILSLYADNKWIRTSVAGIAHGNVAEFSCYVDNFRWLKTARYIVMLPYYIFFKTLPKIEATIELMYSTNEYNKNGEESTSVVQPDTLEGTFVDVLSSCHDPYDPASYIGSSEWFTDHIVLSVYRECSRWQLLRSYLDILFKGDNYVAPDFITEKKVTGYKMKVKNTNIANSNENGTTSYRFTFDGEVVEMNSPEWEQRLHEPVVTVFSSLP